MKNGMHINVLGDKAWWVNGQRHREDGPAYEAADGDKYWYKNGKLHREDGPAYEDANGDKSWWLNNQRHREDGPAVDRANGTKEWYLKGTYYYSFDEWLEKLNIPDEEKVFLKLKLC